MKLMITTVLDQIFAVAELDPAIVNPDDMLGRDFGITPQQIREILSESARLLHIDVALSDRLVDASPRQIVDVLRSSESSWRNAA